MSFFKVVPSSGGLLGWFRKKQPMVGPNGRVLQSMEAQAKAQVINHLFGNGFIPPIYGDLGDGLLLF